MSNLEFIRNIYNREASIYDFTRKFTLFYRRKAINYLNLQPGQVVLDVGCGTGDNFKNLVDKVTASGKIVGIDLSAAMLKIATEKIEKNNYKNIEVVETDALQYTPNCQFDAIFFADSLFIIPQYEEVIKKLTSYLKPNGHIVVLDFKANDYTLLKWINPLWVGISRKYGGNFARKPWQYLDTLFAKQQFKNLLAGFRYIAVYKKIG